MEKLILHKGDKIEVEFQDGTIDWGTFTNFNFDDESSCGHLMYERPQVINNHLLREQILFVPIDELKELRRL